VLWLLRCVARCCCCRLQHVAVHATRATRVHPVLVFLCMCVRGKL
jgi:hypothetical protein